MHHPWWRTKAKLAIVFIYFWSWRLACATHGDGRKRSWPLFSRTFFLLIFSFGPGGLRAPPVVADGSEASHCFHLLSATFFFWSRRLACANCGGRCNRSLPFVTHTFFFFFSLFLSFLFFFIVFFFSLFSLNFSFFSFST